MRSSQLVCVMREEACCFAIRLVLDERRRNSSLFGRPDHLNPDVVCVVVVVLVVHLYDRLVPLFFVIDDGDRLLLALSESRHAVVPSLGGLA